MAHALDNYTRISTGFDTRVRAVGADQWAARCPSCPDWDVRTLVAHVIGSHHHMLSTLGQQHTDPTPDADLSAAWAQARSAVLAALGDPAIAARVVDSPFGQIPFCDLVGGILCGDTLLHTWDLARATEQDDRLEQSACEQVLTGLIPLDAALRGPGRFADKIEPPAGADAQSRLLYFGGRRP